MHIWTYKYKSYTNVGMLQNNNKKKVREFLTLLHINQ